MARVDVSDLLDRGNDLVDAKETRAEGIVLLRSAVEQAPDRVDGLYYLAWALLMDDRASGEAEALLARLVKQTEGVAAPEDGDEPSLEARARSYALAWSLPGRAVRA